MQKANPPVTHSPPNRRGAQAIEVQAAVKSARILVFGDSSVVSRILLQELRRARYAAVDAVTIKDLQRGLLIEHVQLAIILVDIPPTAPLELVRWFRANHPDIKLLLIWEGHWQGRESVRGLSLLPQMIMPFRTEHLVAIVGQLLTQADGSRSSGHLSLVA